MATIENKVKERLAAGQLALGLGLRQARTVDIGRILAACGYDWAFIDMEHNTMGIDTAAQIAVACHDAGVAPIVRVPGYEHYLATRLLDAGAMGIVFPHVDSAKHARTLVDNCKYPPMGHRSLGGPMAQLGFKPYPRSESSAIVNKETMLVVAGQNADAVLAHLPGGVAEDLMAVLETDAEHRVRQQFHHLPPHLEQFFLGQAISFCSARKVAEP